MSSKTGRTAQMLQKRTVRTRFAGAAPLRLSVRQSGVLATAPPPCVGLFGINVRAPHDIGRASFCLKVRLCEILAHDPQAQQLDAAKKDHDGGERGPAAHRVPEQQRAHDDEHEREQGGDAQKCPATEAMDSGTVENATMPSMEYKSREKKFHFVSPATRWTLT